MGFYPYVAIGHGRTTDGNWDCGCTWNGYDEASMAKEVVAGIIEAFKANGKDYLTDYPDNESNITNCVATANNNGCTHYLSIHLDWDRAPSGILPLYVSDAGCAMADCIRAALKARISINDRGNKYQADYECTGTDMPAVIFEIGGICADNDFIRNNARLLGHCVAYGMMDYAGEPYAEVGNSNTVNPVRPGISPEGASSTTGFDWGTDNVQYALNICNYGAPDIDDEWGPETEQCLRIAQGAYGITVDGLWGPQSQSKMEGQIRAYQEALNRHGFACSVDGIAGPETFEAVKAFQRSRGLEDDGIVGENTYPVLMG